MDISMLYGYGTLLYIWVIIYVSSYGLMQTKYDMDMDMQHLYGELLHLF